MKQKTYMVTVEVADQDEDLFETIIPANIRARFSEGAAKVTLVSEIRMTESAEEAQDEITFVKQPPKRSYSPEEAAEMQAAYDDEWPPLDGPWWENR